MSNHTYQIGDIVHGEKFVYDRWYFADGPVQRIMRDRALGRTYLYINGDAYDVEDVTLVKSSGPQEMTQEAALTELQRQLSAGEATRDDYQRAIEWAEGQMWGMHWGGCYDVMRYQQMEVTANVYRTALGLAASDVTQQAAVSPTLSNAEYQIAMAARAPEPMRRNDDNFSCHYCGMPAKNIGFFGEPVCSECDG